jgi:primosomal protein N' (replication factor Y)
VIARVEPLTTARALRGPFDYLAPEGVEVGTMLRVPFGRQELTGVVVGLAQTSDVAPDRLLAPRRVLAQSVPPELVELATWVAGEYCSTTARGLNLVTPPGGAPAKPVFWAQLRRAPAGGERLTDRQRALLGDLAASGPRAAGTDLPALRRLERKGLVELHQRARRASLTHDAVGARTGAPPPLSRPPRSPRSRPVSPQTTRSACCCMASPARARPRSTSGRRRPRSPGGARRSSSFPRSR